MRFLHIAYSQGGIITRMALGLFEKNNPAGWKQRMHMVVFGSGYSWLDREILPDDTHFVYDQGDFVNNWPGGEKWRAVDKEHQEKHTKIIHAYDSSFFGPHVNMGFTGKTPVANSYGWWYYLIGGPVFSA